MSRSIEVVCKTKERTTAVLRDISRGGLHLVSKEPTSVGDAIEVSVRIGRLPEPVRLPGTIVRAWTDDNQRHHAGVKLSELEPETEELLKKLFAALLKPPG